MYHKLTPEEQRIMRQSFEQPAEEVGGDIKHKPSRLDKVTTPMIKRMLWIIAIGVLFWLFAWVMIYVGTLFS